MRVEREYKKTGYFWLPGKEEKKIPGVLSISDRGRVELEIVGHFDEDVKQFNSNEDLSRIIGHVEKDGLVTLERCLYTKMNFAFGGISKSIILVHKVLSGAAWDKGEAVTFNTFSFSVDCLDEWVGISGITVSNDWERKAATINYEPPKEKNFCLDNGMRLEICFSHTLPGSPIIKEAKITQRVYFRLVSEDLRELDDFTTIAFKIVNLMCFAMDEIVAIKDVSATSSEIQSAVDGGKQYSVPISIYFESIPYVEKVPNKNSYEMVFNFNTIKSNAQQVFNGWLRAYEYLSPALSLYFSTKVGAQRYLDGKFLALAQGLETYHRRTSDETLMEPETFEALVANIID